MNLRPKPSSGGRVRRACVVAALVCLGPGCAAVGEYFSERGADLSESIQFAVGGPASGVHAEVGPFLATGLDVWTAYGRHGGTFGNFSSKP